MNKKIVSMLLVCLALTGCASNANKDAKTPKDSKTTTSKVVTTKQSTTTASEDYDQTFFNDGKPSNPKQYEKTVAEAYDYKVSFQPIDNLKFIRVSRSSSIGRDEELNVQDSYNGAKKRATTSMKITLTESKSQNAQESVKALHEINLKKSKDPNEVGEGGKMEVSDIRPFSWKGKTGTAFRTSYTKNGQDRWVAYVYELDFEGNLKLEVSINSNEDENKKVLMETFEDAQKYINQITVEK